MLSSQLVDGNFFWKPARIPNRKSVIIEAHLRHTSHVVTMDQCVQQNLPECGLWIFQFLDAMNPLKTDRFNQELVFQLNEYFSKQKDEVPLGRFLKPKVGVIITESADFHHHVGKELTGVFAEQHKCGACDFAAFDNTQFP